MFLSTHGRRTEERNGKKGRQTGARACVCVLSLHCNSVHEHCGRIKKKQHSSRMAGYGANGCGLGGHGECSVTFASSKYENSRTI